jgi:phosphopantetheinyl transferase (holo-ACP synthase)
MTSLQVASTSPAAGLELMISSDGASSWIRTCVMLAGDEPAGVIARRYLGPSEWPVFEALAPRRRLSWLLGRIAAKEAASRLMRDRGEVDPKRIAIHNDEHGCPTVSVPGVAPLTRVPRVSIAHKPTVAVAAAATLPRSSLWARTPASGIGIDIEAVEARSATFERTVLSTAERSLASVDGEDRDTWLTRLWTVKEAAAKATGLGLRGRPRDFEIDRVAGDSFWCRRGWIRTEPVATAAGRFVMAWTSVERAA